MANSPHLFTLLETAAGYALFEVVAFEEISSSLGASQSQQDAVTSLPLFSRAVKLKAFQPFSSAADALENINAISEHAMTESLKSFLEMNLPSVSSKKKKEGSVSNFSLGVMDSGLATAISEGIPGISCRSDDTIREITRGTRLHLKSYVKGLDGGGEQQAQLGLGHSYSRGKVKFNPDRSDNMIIQSIALLDQMDKDLNTFAMRVKEWYSWHFPELKDLVSDNYMFARCAAFIQDKKSLFLTKGTDENGEKDESEQQMDKFSGLVEIVGDEELVNTITAAAKTSMGMDCSIVDMVNIVNFTQRLVKLAEYRKQLGLYLTEKMAVVAPNLSTLIGDTVAARLISKAGSLTNLAKAPASTVQILGAEKALFRALKTKGNTPKYGLIYHSSFIGRAGAKNKGRISRYLANKCSIATRIDSFSDEPSRIYGEKLREQVEERLKFYETGASPRKNVDVMEEIRKSLDAGRGDDVDMKDVGGEQETPKRKKKSKKDKKSSSKKRQRDAGEDSEEEGMETPAKEVETVENSDDDAAAKKSAKKAAKKSAKKAAKKAAKESAKKAMETPTKDTPGESKEEKESAKKLKKEETPKSSSKKSSKSSSKKKRRKSKE